MGVQGSPPDVRLMLRIYPVVELAGRNEERPVSILHIGEPSLRHKRSPIASMESNSMAVPTKARHQSPSPVPLEFEVELGPTIRSANAEEISRPRVRFDSPSVFFKTLWARFSSIWSKRFILSLLAGQLVAVCITCTDVTTTELVRRGWALPTTQTFFL